MDKQELSTAASQATDSTSGALYDFSGLGKLAKDAELVREIQQMFIGRAPKQVALLLASIEQEEWQAVAQQAHSLKSTLGNLKIERSAALLNQIEKNARPGADKELLKVSLAVVIETVDAVVQAFQQELRSAAA